MRWCHAERGHQRDGAHDVVATDGRTVRWTRPLRVDGHCPVSAKLPYEGGAELGGSV